MFALHSEMFALNLFIYLFIHLLSAPLHVCDEDKDCHSDAKCENGKCICQGKRTGNGKNCRGTVDYYTELIEEKLNKSLLSWSNILIWERKGNPWVDFLIVITASGIARRRVRATMATKSKSRNMAPILQILGWKRHVALVYSALLWYWSSMLWSISTCQNKVSADQYNVTISLTQVYSSSRSSVFLTADRVLVFLLDRGLMSG